MQKWMVSWLNMKIEFKDNFSFRFERQLRFIAKDNLARAKQFKADVLLEIKSLVNFPMRCRKSIYVDDENVRDLIFKGYVITYRVKVEKLEIIGFTKYQNDICD
jgi:plasmid stabilization system protein ParE